MTGFGAHLKATKASLVITRNGHLEQVPLDQIDHLMVMGGHFLHTSVVNVMLRSGKSISFFEADGEPLGTLRPFGDHADERMRKAQEAAPSHSYALKIA
ncbi:MAG TPA: CRISPR-associated endonuclease Cas1, partial [Methanoregulaceae archaeon]|nr:CRISPR-associated endonuclease Cas1 [Methanoregulaceae archaeon]